MLKINSREEILNYGDIIYDEPLFIRNCLGCFHLKDDSYPKYFKYTAPMEVYCCGHYDEVTKEEYIKDIEEEIKNKDTEITQLREKLAWEKENEDRNLF